MRRGKKLGRIFTALNRNSDINIGRDSFGWNFDVNSGRAVLGWNSDFNIRRAALERNFNVKTGGLH
jgi:hypothetical protein